MMCMRSSSSEMASKSIPTVRSVIAVGGGVNMSSVGVGLALVRFRRLVILLGLIMISEGERLKLCSGGASPAEVFESFPLMVFPLRPIWYERFIGST